ncbi:MAG: BON domain-containing protein [Pyrinomonadaceae bacterium]
MKIKFLTIVTIISAVLLAAGCGKSDADLQSAAADALRANAATSSVTVEVKDGVATLSGEVEDDAAKSAAETAVTGVKGVKSVINNITVTPPPPPATADSADQTKIQDALKKAGFTDVTVDTTTTPATLRGSVPKGKMSTAVQVAQEAAGKPVKNEITEK